MNSEYSDKTIVCRDCNQEFVFTVGEQEFFASKGFNEPVRCAKCRKLKKERGGNEAKNERFQNGNSTREFGKTGNNRFNGARY